MMEMEAMLNGKRKQVPTFFVLAILVTVVLTACGGTIQSTTDAASSAAGEEGQGPPEFQINVYHGADVLGGQDVAFSEVLNQGKPVVLNLWAGLCPPCRLEMPDFQEVSDQFGDEVLFLGLDVGPFTNLGTSEDGQALVQELGITYPTGTTADVNVVRKVELIGMPMTVFVTPEGEIVRKWTGLLTKTKLTELVDELLEASAGS
jgi:thiol-disulfide isomerase/thioredoxin